MMAPDNQSVTILTIITLFITIVGLLIIVPLPILNPGVWLFMVVITLLVEFVSGLLHEIGHLVFGWIVGMRLTDMNIGPIRIQRRASRWHLSWHWLGWGVAGRVRMVPYTFHDLSDRWMTHILGGPGFLLINRVGRPGRSGAVDRR